MSSQIRLGYSAWGFLGNGIVNTPDGGRSHRLVLLEELMNRGVRVFMLQKNRDLLEAGEDFSCPQLHFHTEFPDIDALMVEYRWRIPGRNCEVSAEDPVYTPDLNRQIELLNYYIKKGIPIIIWDKDQRLQENELKLFGDRAVIFEPALKPTLGKRSLLFPINMKLLDRARDVISSARTSSRPTQLIYIGNQYERDDSFEEYYESASALLGSPAQIYGKWSGIHSRTGKPFQHVTFHGRVGYEETSRLYTNAFATVLIAPERYYRSGHYTQRLFEASWRACFPLVPREYAEANRIFPKEIIVDSAHDVATKLAKLQATPFSEIREIFQELYQQLEIFSPTHQVDIVMETIRAL